MSTHLPPQPPPMPEYETGSEFDIHRWIDALRRRWRLVAVAAAVALTASVLLYLMTPSAYRATTVLQVEPQAVSMPGMDDILGSTMYRDTAFYATQARLLESRGLAERVVLNLDLADDREFNPSRAELPGDAAEVLVADDERRLASLANRLRGGLTVNPIKDTRLVEISYTSSDPQRAATVANGFAQAYIDWGIEDRAESVGRAASFLSSQIEELKAEIADKEAQLQAYSRRSDIVALDPNSNVVLQRLEALNHDYTAAMSERIQKEAAYNEVTRAPREKVADQFSGGMVSGLRKELMNLESEYSTKLTTYKPEWPAMKELRSTIERSREHYTAVVDEMVGEARAAAQAEYQTALRREQSLASELERQKSAAMNLNSAAVEYNNLKVEVETRRTLLDDLLRRRSETGVVNRLQGTRATNVTVVDRAVVPGSPFRPSLRRNLTGGLAFGLLLGLAGVLGLELFDRRLRTAEDVERVLGIPVLGTIPDTMSPASGHAYSYRLSSAVHTGATGRRGASRAKGEAPQVQRAELIPFHQPRLAVSEAYRSLRTSLLLSAAGGVRSIVVTSAVQGDGKTTTATNLAVVLAQLGRQTLLLDTDLRRPRLHEVLKVSNLRGVVSYLTGDIEPDDIILPTEVANLSLLTSGPIPPNPSELLASSRMRELVEHLRRRFEFLVFDSPPASAVTDATVLGSLVDGVVLTVSADKNTRDEALQAVDRLTLGEVRVLGVVLNRQHRQVGFGYSTSYGAYGTYGEPVATSERDDSNVRAIRT